MLLEKFIITGVWSWIYNIGLDKIIMRGLDMTRIEKKYDKNCGQQSKIF